MSGDLKKRTEEIIDQLEKNGYQIIRSSEHYKIRGKGLPQMSMSKTPSDPRGLENFLSQLKREGYDLTKRRKVNPHGKQVMPNPILRRRLTELLRMLGEVEGGKRSGARAVVMQQMKKVYAQKGLIVPPNDDSYFRPIRIVLAGEKMGQVQLDVLADAVTQLMHEMTPVAPPTATSVFRCDLCNRTFEDLSELSQHQNIYHTTRPQPAEVPKIETNGKSTLADRVLIAVLDPRSTREEALELAAAVRDLL
jgi:stress-induced morphogen